jgi:NADPH:quinone reductase-like Zn-dependent oxidoreductase
MIGVHRWGGYAEYVAVPAQAVCPIPESLSFAEATVIVRHFPVAFALAHRRAGLRAGETALVMGAAGALGSALVQVAKLTGATVIAGAGADDRVAAGRALGADSGVNYRAQDLEQEVRRLTNGRGVDVVFENTGDPALWPGAFNSLAHGGRLATVGAHAGEIVPIDVRRLYTQVQSVLGGAPAQASDVARALEEASAGRIRAVIGATLPLEQAREAHALVEEGRVIGKVILVPPGATAA